jgi:hypothetical protein
VSLTETVKAKLRPAPKGPEAEARAKLARAQQEFEAAEKTHAAAVRDWRNAVRGQQWSRATFLKEKCDRALAALEEPRRRLEAAAAELAALEREARLPAPLREARARQRQAVADHGAAVAALADALRKGQGDSLRPLREKVAEALDAVRLADSAISNIVTLDREEHARARQEKLRTLRGRLGELLPQLDTAFAGLVRLATEAGDVQEQLRGLGEIPPSVSLGQTWTKAALEGWRAAIAREMGPPPAA